MNLPVRRVERIGRCIECRCYRCNLWLTNLHNCEQPETFSPMALKKTDNAARAKLKNHDFFGPFLYQCLHYEYIIIRGISCENCTAATKLGSFSSWTSNSYKSKTEFGCDLDGSPGVNRSENSFGQYRWNTTNSAHRCSSFCLYNSVLAWICLQPVNLRFKKQQIPKKLCRLFLQTPE